VGIVCARAGSKRLKNKNSRKICGIPLYKHALMSLEGTHMINRVVLVTDIKDAKYEWRDILWHEMDDNAILQDSVAYAYQALDEDYDLIVNVFANAPMVSSKDVRNAIALLKRYDMNIVRSYGSDGCENGLIVAKADYYMYHEIDTYTGKLEIEGMEIHNMSELRFVRECME